MKIPAPKSKLASAMASATAIARSHFPAWLMAALLVLVTITLYWPVTGFDFVNFDDPEYVTANPHVLGGVTWQNMGWALTTLHFGLWHPLTWVSHMLDCQCFGLRPGWHHLTNVLLHAANTVLLFVVLRRMTGALWRSALVAALFALHPLHVESVAWVSERKDVLSTFFVLLTLWAYHRYAEGRGPKSKAQGPESKAGERNAVFLSPHHVSRPTVQASAFYLLALLFFACGLMSKPMIVTLPLILLLLDYWPLRRFEVATVVVRPSVAARLLVEKLPFVLAAFMTCLITLGAANRLGSLPSAAQFSMPARLANATVSYARYFLQAFWPGNLAVYYPFPATFSAWSVAGAVVLLVGISVTAFCLARRRPYVVVGWLWYLATLLPVIGLIQLAGYSHADRYTYVPLIGVFVLLVWGIHDLTRRWRSRAICLPSAAVLMVTVCLVLTRRQVGCWRDSETLLRHAIAVTRDNSLAQNNLGVALTKKAQLNEAVARLREAIRLVPNYAEAYNNLGMALAMQGRLDDAITNFQESLRLKPHYAQAHNDLGAALGRQGRMDEAIAHLQEAVKLVPDFADARCNLGDALIGKGRIDEAIAEYQQAIQLNPNYPDIHNHLGIALSSNGRLDEAIGQFQQALNLNANYPEAHGNLGAALGRKGRFDDAINHLQEALRLNPNYAAAQNNLRAALAAKAAAPNQSGPSRGP
jgi:Flp pilus assembly protein TadD